MTLVQYKSCASRISETKHDKTFHVWGILTYVGLAVQGNVMVYVSFDLDSDLKHTSLIWATTLQQYIVDSGKNFPPTSRFMTFLSLIKSFLR